MAMFLNWATKKKRYSEIFVMSDIKTVEFYYKQEFVIIDQKKYAE